MNPVRSIIMSFAVFVAAIAFTQEAYAIDAINQSFFGGVAIHGYDPVAYYLERKPVEGSDNFEFEWMGATWRFASERNLEIFKAKPEHYAPQYGGYCAYAVSQGVNSDIDPNAWKIVDAKLYLNLNNRIQKIWLQDIPGYIRMADANWPRLLNGN